MSIAPRRAIYGKLAGDTTLTSMLGTPPAGKSQNIYDGVAFQNAGFPYVVLNKQSGTPSYALGSRAYDDDVWLIKGVDRGTDADVVEAISARLDTLLTDAVISISGRTELYLRRISDVDYAEVVDGVTYRHSGSLFRLIYQ